MSCNITKPMEAQRNFENSQPVFGSFVAVFFFLFFLLLIIFFSLQKSRKIQQQKYAKNHLERWDENVINWELPIDWRWERHKERRHDFVCKFIKGWAVFWNEISFWIHFPMNNEGEWLPATFERWSWWNGRSSDVHIKSLEMMNTNTFKWIQLSSTSWWSRTNSQYIDFESILTDQSTGATQLHS